MRSFNEFLRLFAAVAIGTAMLITTASASFVANFHQNFGNPGDPSLFIFGEAGTMGTITNNAGFNESFTIGADGQFAIRFDDSAFLTPNALSQTSFFVESSDAISGLALNRESQTSDMTVLLDTQALGTDYVVMGYNPLSTLGSQFSVTAIEDNTRVTITSPIALNGNPANTPFDIVLNRGESFAYDASADVTGTFVSASSSVAVFGGARCTQVPTGTTACDHLISQNFSTDNFDTRFLLSENFGGGTDADLVRVLTATDNTEVFINGVSQGIINAGEFIEVDRVGNGVVTSTQPVTVGQFVRGQGGSRTTGDPAFAIIPSEDQLLDSYVFSTPTGQDAYPQNYLNIAIRVDGLGSLRLNGGAVDTSGFSILDGYAFGNIAIGLGLGSISADIAFLATIAGFDGFDSYFSVIASAFSPGASPPPPPSNTVPLPAGFILMITGLSGLVAASRKRKLSA